MLRSTRAGAGAPVFEPERRRSAVAQPSSSPAHSRDSLARGRSPHVLDSREPTSSIGVNAWPRQAQSRDPASAREAPRRGHGSGSAPYGWRPRQTRCGATQAQPTSGADPRRRSSTASSSGSSKPSSPAPAPAPVRASARCGGSSRANSAAFSAAASSPMGRSSQATYHLRDTPGGAWPSGSEAAAMQAKLPPYTFLPSFTRTRGPLPPGRATRSRQRPRRARGACRRPRSRGW